MSERPSLVVYLSETIASCASDVRLHATEKTTDHRLLVITLRIFIVIGNDSMLTPYKILASGKQRQQTGGDCSAEIGKEGNSGYG